MRLTLLRLLTFAVIVFFSLPSRAQNCIATNINNSVIDLACNQTCKNLRFSIPHIKSTSDYTVTTIPYNPFPYTTAGGTEDPNIYNDDRYSTLFTLPFKFCFYDSLFTKVTVGSNGIISFDYEIGACNLNTLTAAWSIANPVPWNSGFAPCNSNISNYPRASIMGVFQDLDPRPGPNSSTVSSPPDRKIEWRVEGTAPCRKFVVSYYHIGVFQQQACGVDPATAATFQIVLHESTGLIDVFIQNKSCVASSTNGANAVLGIQNWARTKGVAAPGKNAVPWTSSNEGYQFIPSAGASRYMSSKIYTLSGTFIADADTMTTTAGLLDLNFANVCFPTGSSQYKIVTTFSACDDASTLLVTEDTITVNRTNDLLATATATNTACGPPSGTITVTVPAGIGTSPFTYTLDGTNIQTGPSPFTFTNIAAGNHDILVVDNSGGCTSTIRVSVGRDNNLSANLSSAPASCAGASNGSLTITPTNGVGPYTFTLNPGNIVQTGATSATFNNLAAGTYNVSFSDNSGCTLTPAYVAVISAGAGLTANMSSAPASCPGASNGSLTVTPTSGTGPYTFTLNPGNIVQTAPAATTFNNLVGGTYNVAMTDANGCIVTPPLVAVVTSGAGITSNISEVPASCPGVSNGTVTVTPTSGVGPYTFTLSPGAVIQTGAANTTFAGLASGNYTVTVRDANNCTTSAPLSISVTSGTGITATASAAPASCPGAPNGSLTVTPTSGAGPYTFTLNPGSIVQTAPGATTFNNLVGGTYNINMTDANGCIVTPALVTIVSSGAGINSNISATPTSCPGVNNGTVIVTPTSGAGPYTFTLNPGNIIQTGAITTTFTGLASGNYTVIVRDANNCTTSAPLSTSISTGAGITGTASAAPTACPGVNNGSVTATATSGTGPFTFTLNPGNIIQTGAVNTTFNGLAPGNYTISIVDAGGCSTGSPATANVTSGTSLTATASQTATTCQGANNGSITITPTNGTAPFTFILDGTTTQTGATNTTFINLPAGNHTIMITDASGCTSIPAVSITIAAGAVLSATATATSTSCAGANNGTATITPTNGSAPYSFLLDGATTQTGATTTFNNLASGPHSVVVSDASGCVSNPISINIPAGAALATTATHTDVLCNGGSTGSITVAPPASPGPFEYSLNNSNWQTTNLFSGLPAGSYTVYFREISSGCTGQLPQIVTEPIALAATPSFIPVVCNGQNNGIITVNTNGGKTPYEYSVNGGTNWQTANTFNVAAGTYTITIRDANLCVTTSTITVTEPAALTATATTTNATCNGGNDGAITVTATGGNAGYQYSSDGTTFQASNILKVVAGTYTVTVKDNLGCVFTIPNVVVGMINDLTYTVPASSTICEGTSTQLQITSNALQYAWTPTTGLSNPAIANPLASPPVTTNYMVKVTLGNCSADVPVTVNVNTAPIPNAGADGFICYGQNYQLQASGGVNYKWTPATYLDNASVFNPVSTPDKTITYSLSVSDANGCNSLLTDDVIIDVTPPIRIKTYPSDTVVHPNAQFQALAISVATDYLWSPSTGLSSTTIANPVVTAGSIGDVILYKVTGSTQAGCKGEGYVRVRVYTGPELYVPTGFTPNNDGKNDKFFPFPVGVKEIKYFRVFDRWGNMVFSTSRLNDGWDGKYGGRETASGVYVWVVEGITIDNKVINKKGTVMLIR